MSKYNEECRAVTLSRVSSGIGHGLGKGLVELQDSHEVVEALNLGNPIVTGVSVNLMRAKDKTGNNASWVIVG